MQLNVEIKKRVATYKEGTETPICGNSGDTIKFSFDDEWAAHDQKTARFIWGGKYHDVEFTGDTCEVPVVTNTQALLVGVYVGEAPDDEPLLSSTLTSITYALSVRCAKATAGAGTGANYTNEAKGYATEANASAKNAKAGETAAAASATNAKASENAAAASAASAKASEEKTNSNMNKVEEYIEQIMSFDPFVTDATNKSIKDVPEKALFFAEVTKIGGMTYKDGDTLKHAKVTEVKSVGANLIPFPYIDMNTSFGGGSMVANEDGGIALSGTPTAISYLCLYSGTPLKGVVTLSTSGAFKNARAFLTLKNQSDEIIYDNAALPTLTCNIDDYPSATKMEISLIRTENNVAISGVCYVMLNKGATAKPYTPYVKHIFPIPEEVQALDGYGLGVNDTVYNDIDWEKQQFVKRVGVVDLGTLDWRNGSFAGEFLSALKDDAVDMGYGGTGLCSKYSARYSNDDKSVYTTKISSEIGCVVIDRAYTDAATFKAAMSGVMLVYELAEPEVTDISDLITDENLVRVKAGGTVTFVNEHAKDVPNTIIYQVVR